MVSADRPRNAAPPSSLRALVVALGALRRLIADPGDTAQVFRIVRTLNQRSIGRNHARLSRSAEGRRIAAAQVELRPLLTDPAWLARCPAGSVGAAYASFLAETGYSADGLAEIAERDDPGRDHVGREMPHAHAWFARRQRDTHDIWHVLTGYRADEPLGEACLVGFTYAQMRSAGWRLIWLGAMAKALTMPRGRLAVMAMIEGWRRGRAASWLPDEDYAQLLMEPLEAARRRLRITPARRYDAIQVVLAARAGQAPLGPVTSR